MGENGRKLYGLERSPDNSLVVVCGGEFVVAAARNVAAMDDVAVSIDVVVLVGATAKVAMSLEIN